MLHDSNDRVLRSPERAERGRWWRRRHPFWAECHVELELAVVTVVVEVHAEVDVGAGVATFLVVDTSSSSNSVSWSTQRNGWQVNNHVVFQRDSIATLQVQDHDGLSSPAFELSPSLR